MSAAAIGAPINARSCRTLAPQSNATYVIDLRTRRLYHVFRTVLGRCLGKPDFRIVHLSIQKIHLDRGSIESRGPHLRDAGLRDQFCDPDQVSRPQTGLLRHDLERFGRIDPYETPGPLF
jgi:hypothetical protein